MNLDLLKHIALQLCTCTWIEIMTGAGITLYLLYLHNYMLAAINLAVFAPLITFHFVMTAISKSEDYCSDSRCLRRSTSSSVDLVAKVVLTAVKSENPSVRYLAGKDVEMWIEGKKTMSDDEFYKMMKQNMVTK